MSEHSSDIDRLKVAVRGRLQARLGLSDLPDDQPLADLGFDSLDVIVVVTELEDDLGVEFPEEKIFREECWTVQGIASLLLAARLDHGDGGRR